MNTTFLIGNGFDLRLKMNTKYSDVYKTYVNAPSANESIKRLKALLKEDAPKGYKTWGDFEMAMGRHSQEFENVDDFVVCVRDFKEYMCKYLKKEQSDFINKVKAIPDYEKIIAEEMMRSISNYYMGQDNNSIAIIKRLKRMYSLQNDQFITFNYTIILDYLLALMEKCELWILRDPVHIHGSLDGDVVLGVDNITQISKECFRDLKKVHRSFIKPLYNQMYDAERVKTACSMINTSHVICIYGLALGESDEVWRKAIYTWLKQDKEHQLIYYMYDEHTYNMWLRDEIMDKEEERKYELMQKLGVPALEVDELFDQIHVPVGYDIFDFDKKLEEQRIKTEPQYMTATSSPIEK